MTQLAVCRNWITRQITKSQNRKTDNLPSNQHAGLSDIREKLVKVRASVSVMVLLGLAWILGPLMLIDPVPALKKPISYLFTVCNSLQVTSCEYCVSYCPLIIKFSYTVGRTFHCALPLQFFKDKSNWFVFFRASYFSSFTVRLRRTSRSGGRHI